MLAGPVRSGWAGRLLCADLCLPCGVELRWTCGAGAEWLGRSASLRSLVSWLWFELRYACGNGAEWLGLSVPPRVVAVPLPGRLVCCCEAGVEWLGTSASLLSLASSLWSRIALCSRGRCGVAGHVGLSALACVFPVGSNCIMLAGPVWLGTSASPRSLVSSLWVRIALCSRVGLSALACVFPVGSNCAALAEPALSGWARRPLCVRLCPCCGVGLRRLFGCLFGCLFVVFMYVAAAGAAARRASTCSSRRPESVCVRLPRLRPVPLPSPLFLPPPPPPPGCCLLLCVPCLPP